METLLKIKEEIKKGIAKGMDTAFTTLEALLSPESSKYTLFLQLKGRYSIAKEHLNLGTISFADNELITNQVRYALLIEVIDKLEKKDFRDYTHISTESIYQQKPKLPFDLKLPRFKMDVLRIDRKDVTTIFEERRKSLKNIPVQHYFIYGDRHQQPRSFVERIVFELESKSEIIQYEAKGDKHLKVKDLEMVGNLEISKLRFCEYFSERFGANISSLSDIATITGPGDTNCLTTTALKFHVEEWEDYTFDFFKWILSEFSQTDGNPSTQFLFFYIIQKDTFSEGMGRKIKWLFNGRFSRQKKAERTLKKLKKFPNCTVLPELQPVLRHDLNKWLEEFISNETEIDNLVSTIAENQKNLKKLDMSIIENQLVKTISN